MRLRDVVAVVGVGAAIVGLVSAFTSASFGFNLTYTFVTLVGLLAILQGVRYGLARRQLEFPEAETDDPEKRHEVPVPGDDFDDELAAASGWSMRSVSHRQDLEARLRAAAVESLVAYEGYHREEATASVEAGRWTGDAVAAAFLADASADLPKRSLSSRFRSLFRRQSYFGYRVSRAVSAIAAVQEGTR